MGIGVAKTNKAIDALAAFAGLLKYYNQNGFQPLSSNPSSLPPAAI